MLAIYGLFVLGEGLPPVGSQPQGVQLSFVAVGLMLLGFVVGWKREGTAALLIASGWTLWHVSEGRIGLNAFQAPLPVAALYALWWWATNGRKTRVLAGTVALLAVALGLGRLFCPTSVFVRAHVTDAQTGRPIANAQLTLDPRPGWQPGRPGPPNARSGKDGQVALYVGWYVEQNRVHVSAPGYAMLTTNLGPRALGQRNVRRDYQLQPTRNASDPFAAVPPVVIATVPESGVANVDPALTELRVTFSKPMQDGSWAWTKWGDENFPEMTGQPRFLADERTCALPVRLQPGKAYAIWLNSQYHQDFKDREGRSAVPYLLIFETRR